MKVVVTMKVVGTGRPYRPGVVDAVVAEVVADAVVAEVVVDAVLCL